MIENLGVDIVDIDRFKSAVERWGDHFLEKILTPDEIRHCQGKAAGILSMAVRFAAKEAFIKCLDEEQFKYFTWQAVEVVSAPTGKPSLKLNGGLAALFRDRRIFISLSHTESSAVAVVVVEPYV